MKNLEVRIAGYSLKVGVELNKVPNEVTKRKITCAKPRKGGVPLLVIANTVIPNKVSLEERTIALSQAGIYSIAKYRKFLIEIWKLLNTTAELTQISMIPQNQLQKMIPCDTATSSIVLGIAIADLKALKLLSGRNRYGKISCSEEVAVAVIKGVINSTTARVAWKYEAKGREVVAIAKLYQKSSMKRSSFVNFCSTRVGMNQKEISKLIKSLVDSKAAVITKNVKISKIVMVATKNQVDEIVPKQFK